MRNYKSRREEMIENYIKNGRYTYSNGKLYDNKLKEDVSDLLEGTEMNENVKVKENEPEIKEEVKAETNEEAKPESVKEDKDMYETKNLDKTDSYFDLSGFSKFQMLSDDGSMIISFAQTNPKFDNNLYHYKFSKYFQHHIHPVTFPKLNYKSENTSYSLLNFEHLRNAIQFFKEYAKKNSIEIDKISFYIKHFYPVSLLCSFTEGKILIVIAQREIPE